MKPIAHYLALALLLGASLLAPAPAGAAIELRPTQITIHAESGTKVPIDIQLRVGEEIEDLQAQPTGIPTTGGTPGIPAQRFTVRLAPHQKRASDNTVSATVELDLAGIPAGEYSGDLPFTYSVRDIDRKSAPDQRAVPEQPEPPKKLKGGEIRLPIRVTVRHPWPLPLAVMVFGIALGVGLSIYRSRGRPRDQVLVRVGLVRAFLQRDRTMSQGIVPVYQDPLPGAAPDPSPADSSASGLPNRPIDNPFRIRLDAMLIDVEMSLQSERWEEARNKMDQTEVLLRKWVQGRLGWIKQLAYLARLQELLNSKSGSGRYLPALRTTVQGLIANAPAKESPDALRDDAQTLADQIDVYERLSQKLDLLEHLRMGLRDGAAERLWSARIEQLRQQLDAMRPDPQATKDLLTDIDKAVIELEGQMPQAAATGSSPEGAPVGTRGVFLTTNPATSVEQAPEEHLGWPDEISLDGAAGRLRLFLYASYAVALVLLTGAGFNQVYMKKANFGADLWADYFALLIWGFGAEATRDSVTTTLRGWGLPIDSKTTETK